MAIKYHIEPERELLIAYIPRETTIDSLDKSLAFLSAQSELATYHTLLIISDADSIYQQVKAPVLAIKMEKLFGSQGEYKLAILVSGILDYGLARMFTSYRGREGELSKVSTDPMESLEFVGVSASETSRLLDKIKNLILESGDDRWF